MRDLGVVQDPGAGGEVPIGVAVVENGELVQNR